MKFIADENIPQEVIDTLKSQEIDIISIFDIKAGLSDEEVLTFSRKEKRTLITFDKDFGEMIFRKKMKNEGVIFLRLHPQSPEEITQLLKKIFQMKIDFTTSFCVVEKERLRIIPLNQ